MLAKPHYPSFNQFVLALQSHNHFVERENEDEKPELIILKDFVRERGQETEGHQFNTKGKGFAPAGNPTIIDQQRLDLIIINQH